MLRHPQLLNSTWLPTSVPHLRLNPRIDAILGMIMCLFTFLRFPVYFWGAVWILCATLASI